MRPSVRPRVHERKEDGSTGFMNIMGNVWESEPCFQPLTLSSLHTVTDHKLDDGNVAVAIPARPLTSFLAQFRGGNL